MKVFWFALLGCLFASGLYAKPKITVLDVKVQGKGFDENQLGTLEELIRSGVTQAVSGKLLMMDKESLYEILKDADIAPSQCSEAECEVDLFRRMQADFGITPVLLQVGERFKLLLKLHQASNGEVLKVSELYGQKLADFDHGLEAAIAKLLEPLFARLEKDVFGRVTEDVTVEQGGELQFKQVESVVVTIASDPPQADLFIDNKLIGTTGKAGNKQPLAFGRHKVRVELANHVPTEQVVEVQKGMKETTLTLKLLSSLREVVLGSKPEPGAEVYLGGELMGLTPLKKTLRIGTYELRLQRDLYLPHKTQLDITAATKAGEELTYELIPNFGLFSLTTDPPGIAVQLDGEEVGKTPLLDHRLRLGVHDIELKDPRYFGVKIDKLQVSERLGKLVKHFELKQKFGGIDLGAQDENHSLVVAEVYLDGVKVGETAPRFQHKMPVGSYRLEVRTSHRTFSDTVVVTEHGQMYQKDILLHSLTDEELATQETERQRLESRKELHRAQEEEKAEFQRVANLRRPKNLILYPALLVALCTGGGSTYLFLTALDDQRAAESALDHYQQTLEPSRLNSLLTEANDLKSKATWKMLAAAGLAGLSLGAFGVALYELVQLPPWPERRYTVVPMLGSEVVGLSVGGRW